MVDEYGADALKFTIAFLAAQGQDILMNKESFKLGSKFANKIWNASRFLLMNLEGRELVPADKLERDEVDRWILSRLNEAVKAARSSLEQYRFYDAAQAVYEFFWNEFCDWYIEASKLKLDDRKASLLLSILEEALRLLHPLLPFVTEEIYQKLPGHSLSIMTAPYPEVREERADLKAEERFARVQELVRAVRTLRSEFTIPIDRTIRLAVAVEEGFPAAAALHDHRDLIALLVNAGELTIGGRGIPKEGAIPVMGTGFEAFVYIRELIDLDKETARLKKELAGLEEVRSRTEAKLANQAFLAKAPEAVVVKEREKLEELARRREKIEEYLRELQP